MVSCKTHPKYQAKLKPKVPCEECWAMWFGLTTRCFTDCCQEAYQQAIDRLTNG